MVGNRPVVGVRNPVGLSFPSSYSRAKKTCLTEYGANPLPHATHPGKRHLNFEQIFEPRVSPVLLLEAARNFHSKHA
jgi:hypothetical protein